MDGAHFTVSVEIDGTMFDVYVTKRPGLAEFLEAVAKHYELIVFTASISKVRGSFRGMPR